MTHGPENDIAATVSGAFPRTQRPQPGRYWQEGIAIPRERGGLASPLLAWAALLAFCSGLIGLAASSLLEASPPRWLIQAYGGGCFLLALLAALLSGPGCRRSTRRAGGPGTQRSNPSSQPRSSGPGSDLA